MKKVLVWAFNIWLVGVTARYCTTIWKTLEHPFNPGEDVPWFAGWALLCGLLVLGVSFLPERIVLRGTLGVCIVAAAAVFTFSHTWFPAAIALWLLLVCAGIGLAIVEKLGLIADFPVDLIAVAIPVGMAALALVLFALSLAGRLSVIWITCILVAGTLLHLLPNVRERMSLFRTFPGVSRESVLPAALIAFSALLNLTWAVAPEINFDALNYHLAIPQVYLRAGGLVDVRFLHAYLSKLLEFLFAAGLALGGQTAVKLFVYGLGLCAMAATYALGRALFGVRAGAWAAALFYSTPVVAWLTGTVYIDNVVALFAATGLLLFVRWFETRKACFFNATFIVAGMAVGSKLSAAFVFLIILPVMAFGMRRQWRTVLIGAGVFLCIALPTYVVTWRFVGNPVFPLLNGVFKSPAWPTENAVFNSAAYGLPATLSNLAVFPFRLTFDSTRFGEAVPRGALGLSLLLAFPFAVCFLPGLGRAVQAVLIATFVYLVVLFYTMQYARYYVAILPAIAVFAAATVFEGTAKSPSVAGWAAKACLTLAVVVQFPALTTQYWNIPERFPVGVAFGLESREAFALRTLDGYASAMYINKTATEGDRILGADVEHLRFYLDVPLTTPSLSLLDNPIRPLSEMKPGPELATAIREAGFTRLLVRTAQLRESVPGYPYFDKAFLDSYATLEFSDGSASVYRFRDPVRR